MINERRYDLDWLRAIAFFILIYFHAAIIFIPDGLPLIQNPETSIAMDWFVNISHQFRLALLFFISGVGVYFAKRKRTDKEFFQERSIRLLIPLVMSLFIVVPPMVYLEKLFIGEFDGSLFAFYAELFNGIYPSGNFSWHHMWFIAYLYLFCVISPVVLRWLDNRHQQIAQRFSGFRIYLFVLILLIPEILLRPLFPGFRDLIHDWASFTHWLLIFWAGYLMAQEVQLLNVAQRLWPVSLSLSVATTGLIIGIFGEMQFRPDLNDPNVIYQFVLYATLRMTMVWSTILTCLGLAGCYLRFSNSILTYVNEALYPLFILHLTTTTMLGYWVVPLDLSITSKYLLVTTGTIGIVMLAYHFLIRPFSLPRLLFGVKPKPR